MRRIPGSELEWDTVGDDGRAVPNGLFMFVIEPDGEKEVYGRILIMRSP